jgi:hypothetical protein
MARLRPVAYVRVFTVIHAPSYPAGNLLQIELAAFVFTVVFVLTFS